jgi:alanine-synthesizing transaminase
MFVWAPMPENFHPLGSLEFAKLLLREAHVAVSPGIGFGEFGNQFVRIGLIENETRIEQALHKLNKVVTKDIYVSNTTTSEVVLL